MLVKVYFILIKEVIFSIVSCNAYLLNSRSGDCLIYYNENTSFSEIFIKGNVIGKFRAIGDLEVLKMTEKNKK